MTKQGVLDLLRRRIMEAGNNASRAAEAMNVSPQYVSDVLSGKREPGPKLLGPLGLEAEVKVVYRRKGKTA